VDFPERLIRTGATLAPGFPHDIFFPSPRLSNAADAAISVVFPVTVMAVGHNLFNLTFTLMECVTGGFV
jgi:hypothetical protein